jgi:tetratricopeptide (TPR) repeat protein
LGDLLVGTLIVGVVVSVVWVVATEVFPRAMARRVARPSEEPFTELPGDTRLNDVVSVSAETALESSKRAHDAFVADAADLERQARGAGLFAAGLLEEAAAKLDDAIRLRPGSFPALMLSGEVLVKRALIVGRGEAVALLDEAAGRFAAAGESKPGVIDSFIGQGWANLECGLLLAGAAAVGRFDAAAGAFSAGFAVSPQNLHILRGWGLAIDGMARAGEETNSHAEWEARYQAALAQHRGGDHELYAWFAAVRGSADPVRLAMPPLRDI